MEASKRSAVLAKVEAAIRLAESLRLNALDVEIWLHEIAGDLRGGDVHRVHASLADLDLFGLRAHSTAEEEYRPGERDWCP